MIKNNLENSHKNINEIFYKKYFFPKFLDILKILDKNHGMRAIPLVLIRQQAGWKFKLKRDETKKILLLMHKEGLIRFNSHGVYLIEDKPRMVEEKRKIMVQMGLDKWCSVKKTEDWRYMSGDERTKAYLKSYGIGAEKDE